MAGVVAWDHSHGRDDGLVLYVAWKRDYPLTGEPFSVRNVINVMRGSLIVFLMRSL